MEIGFSFIILAYLGTAFAAMSGALIAIENELDAVGMVTLATVSGLGGGIIRDIFLGDLPPATIVSYDYLVICAVSASVTLFYYRAIKKLEILIVIVDAMGLGLFLIYGLEKAVAYHMNTIAVILMGIFTSTFGGVLRDVLINRLPYIFRTEIYLVNALLGALLFVFIQGYFPTWLVDIIVSSFVIILRFITYFKKCDFPSQKNIDFKEDFYYEKMDGIIIYDFIFL